MLARKLVVRALAHRKRRQQASKYDTEHIKQRVLCWKGVYLSPRRLNVVLGCLAVLNYSRDAAVESRTSRQEKARAVHTVLL